MEKLQLAKTKKSENVYWDVFCHCDFPFREHRRVKSETIQSKLIRIPEREEYG
jgi:hypothetical protein